MESITIVGHSIGGIVARALPILHHLNQNSKSTQISVMKKLPTINAIITLATPHQMFPYAFDESVSHFFHSVNDIWKKSKDEHLNCKDCSQADIPPVISISGGLRDELVQPKSCNLENIQPSSYTVRDFLIERTSFLKIILMETS